MVFLVCIIERKPTSRRILKEWLTWGLVAITVMKLRNSLQLSKIAHVATNFIGTVATCAHSTDISDKFKKSF